MEFRYKYYGATTVDGSARDQAFKFAPDTLRPPTYFEGVLRHDAVASLRFREALSALHEVVVSDARYRGRDPEAYKSWLAANESALLAAYMAGVGKLKAQAQQLSEELKALRAKKHELLQPFYKAQRKYFDWLYMANRDAWFVLDPVITVHPQRLLFEAFSQDESSYCAVSVGHGVFERTGEMACGTTNIDYSASLYEEFQKIRDYKATRFTVDLAGFTVATGNDPAFHEEKIDLPDSWVRGFLQVSSAMTLPATVVELHPMDLHGICATLRQHRERAGPRSLRFELAPEQPARLVFEPWNIVLEARRSRIEGEALTQPLSVRVWGRRRLLTLERLIALATRTGLPQADVRAALGLWVQAGRAVFDLPAQSFAWRELAREPLPLAQLRFASPEEERALPLAQSKGTRIASLERSDGRIVITGTVGDAKTEHAPRLALDADEQLREGECNCNFFKQNKLRMGPCAHMLALRMVAQPRLDAQRLQAPATTQEAA